MLDSGETLRNTDLTYLPYQPAAYAYCSDTNYSARLAGMVEGVDLLYHEATYAADSRRIAKERGPLHHGRCRDGGGESLGQKTHQSDTSPRDTK